MSRGRPRILGAAGIALDRHAASQLLNLEASYAYGGTHEIHSLVIGKELCGERGF